MPTVAVVVHMKKVRGDGLLRLREALADAGHPDPLWFEVAKSKKARKRSRARPTRART